MFPILLSAANAVLVWTFRTVVIKFLIFTALYLVTVELTEAAISAIGAMPTDDVGGALGGLPASVLWGLSATRLDYGIPVLLSASAVAFGIRRLPVIG